MEESRTKGGSWSVEDEDDGGGDVTDGSCGGERDGWKEVTDVVEMAIASLDSGQMIHGPHFSLLEAMSVIELGDPKMDVGAGPRLRLEDCPLPQNLSTEEVTLVCDRLLACVVTWLESHLLPQTVFSCIFLFNLDLITHPGLECFCRVALGIVALSFEAISEAMVADEEDFIRYTFGFTLDVLEEERVKDLLRAGLIYESSEESPETRAPLHARLELVASLYLSLLHLSRAKSGEGLAMAEVHLRGCMRNMKEVRGSILPGKEDDDACAPGFYPSLNKHLLPSAPPRTSEIMSRMKAFAILNALLGHLLLVSQRLSIATTDEEGRDEDSTALPRPRMSVFGVLQAVALFSSREGPSTLARSLLKLWLVPSSNHVYGELGLSWTHLVASDLQEEQAALERNHPLAIAKLVSLVKVLVISLCRNRGRQRRCLVHFLERWDATCPTLLKSLTDRTIRITMDRFCRKIAVFAMEQHLFLGFDCDLYGRLELRHVYSYLTHIKIFPLAGHLETVPGPESDHELLQTALNEGILWLCRAMVSLLSWMELAGLIVHPGLSENEKRLAYDQRFECVGKRAFGPSYLTYSSNEKMNYCAGTATRRDDQCANIFGTSPNLEGTGALFGFAKRIFESVSPPAAESSVYLEIKRLLAVSNINADRCSTRDPKVRDAPCVFRLVSF